MPSPKALCSASSLPPTVGAFQDPFGNAAANGFIALDISGPALITGGGELSGKRVIITLDANGKVAAGQSLYANDQLTPSTTTYRMTVYDGSGNFLMDFGRQDIAGTAPIDLALLEPSFDVGSAIVTPITFVQSAKVENNTTLAFASNNQSGSIIIVAFSNTNQTAVTVSDTKANTYTSLSRVLISTGQMQIFYAPNISSGANSITTSTSGNFAIHEISGLLDTVDVSNSATGSGTSQSSGSITTRVANELIFGFTAGLATSVSGLTGGAGFTTAQTLQGATTTPAFITQYKIVSSISNFTASSTCTLGKGGSYQWGCEVVSFYR